MTAKTNQKFGLIVVAAPSGAGKSTLCTHFLGEWPHRVSLSISSTSRAPRGREKHGKEYHFLTKEDFAKKIDENEFAEWALVHENYYGTSKAALEEVWSHGKHVLLDIDVQGAESLRKLYGDRCLTVFIAPPSIEELERRLRGRGTETEEAIQKRMQNAIHELKEKEKFDLVLVNDHYEQTYQNLENAILKFMDELEKKED